jgi:2,3,4,5-tetrahydropyridine-2-carboxylate N-succinyltransferase
VGHVVALGNLLSKFGTYSLYSAIIVKKFDEKTRAKIGINTLLRSFSEEKII